VAGKLVWVGEVITSIRGLTHGHCVCACLCMCVQVWRVPDCPGLYQQLRPTFEQLPPHFQASKHYHLGIHASHPPMKLLRALQAATHSNGGESLYIKFLGKRGGEEGLHWWSKKGVCVGETRTRYWGDVSETTQADNCVWLLLL
jgi:hypothetical protein